MRVARIAESMKEAASAVALSLLGLLTFFLVVAAVIGGLALLATVVFNAIPGVGPEMSFAIVLVVLVGVYFTATVGHTIGSELWESLSFRMECHRYNRRERTGRS